jgi:hypothetical protein
MRKKFELRTHVKTGLELAVIRDTLMRLHVSLSDTYGKTSQVARSASKAAASLDALRSKLDDKVCSESPADDFYPYYPQTINRDTCN